jgi:hypothetical protein
LENGCQEETDFFMRKSDLPNDASRPVPFRKRRFNNLSPIILILFGLRREKAEVSVLKRYTPKSLTGTRQPLVCTRSDLRHPTGWPGLSVGRTAAVAFNAVWLICAHKQMRQPLEELPQKPS